MNLRLVVTAEADRDLEEAMAWYDGRETGIGQRFLSATRARFGDILADPLRPCARGRRYVRKVRVPKFPYAIYYEIFGEELRVLAIIHDARDPKYLNYRLRRLPI